MSALEEAGGRADLHVCVRVTVVSLVLSDGQIQPFQYVAFRVEAQVVRKGLMNCGFVTSRTEVKQLPLPDAWAAPGPVPHWLSDRPGVSAL